MRATHKFSLQISAGLLLLTAVALPAAAQGGGGGIGNTTSTPVAGVPHDYITGLNEVVNPANGALSIRIAQPVPHQRGQNWPAYAFIYDSNSVFIMAPKWVTGGNTAITSLTYCAFGASSSPYCTNPGVPPQAPWRTT